MSTGFRFNAMHFMPYVYLPENHKEFKTTWVDFPNKFYDPVKGHELYQRYFEQLVLADRLGFDAIVLNEHHNTVYSMMATPSVVAAALIPQTKRARICVWGVPPNFMLPNRLAEEYAILDVMSRGRLEIAFPLGTGMEYWSNSVVNPASARAKFRESIDIMIRAWTEEGPTTYDGEFYSYCYLNVWPRPYQRPYPRCYIVGTGSPETIAFAAERGLGYASVFVPITQQVKTFKAMRETMLKHGHEMTPDKAMANTIVYVAETDEIAQKEAKEHIKYYFTVAARTTPRYLAPPGYISLDQFRVRAGAATKMHGGFDWDEMTKNWRVAVGTP